MHLNTTLPELPKFRVLVIHGECDINTGTAMSESFLINERFISGFAANGSNIMAKTRPIRQRITEMMTPEILSEFPGGIEFLSPDGALLLEPPIGLGWNGYDFENEAEKQATIDEGRQGQINMGWWYGRDTVNEYRGIEHSLSSVARFLHGTPIQGVIGFSQGAALAGMVCSLLECHKNPDKIAAIRAQGLPVDDYLSLPDQERLRFIIAIGGYQGSPKYYGSLYQWPLQTPSIHTFASMDAIVEPVLSMNLARSFTSYETVEYFGSHFVPRDPASVNALARFAAHASVRYLSPSSPIATPSLSQSLATSEDEDFHTASSRTGSSGRSTRSVAAWKRKRRTCVKRACRIRVPAGPPGKVEGKISIRSL